MQVSLQLEPKDLQIYAAFIRGGRAGVFIQRAMPWVLLVGGALLAIYLDVAHDPTALVLLLFFPGWWVVLFIWQRRSMRRKGSAVFAPKTLIVGDSGMTTEGDMGTSTTNWSHVKGFVRGREHVFIMLDGLAGHIVPTRCFSGGTQLEEFLSELRSHTKELPPPSGTKVVALWLALLAFLLASWWFF
jgi:hypothetical protein